MRLTAIQLATAVALLLVGAPIAAEAQQAGKVYRIGILVPGPTSPQIDGSGAVMLSPVMFPPVPGVSPIAVLWNSANPIIARQLRETEVAAEVLRTKLHIVDVRGPDDFERTFRAVICGSHDTAISQITRA